MDVQIKHAAEALDQRDRAGASCLIRKTRLLDQMRGDDAIDDAQHLAHRITVTPYHLHYYLMDL